jgi:hypothetical protein
MDAVRARGSAMQPPVGKPAAEQFHGGSAPRPSRRTSRRLAEVEPGHAAGTAGEALLERVGVGGRPHGTEFVRVVSLGPADRPCDREHDRHEQGGGGEQPWQLAHALVRRRDRARLRREDGGRRRREGRPQACVELIVGRVHGDSGTGVGSNEEEVSAVRIASRALRA